MCSWCFHGSGLGRYVVRLSGARTAVRLVVAAPSPAREVPFRYVLDPHRRGRSRRTPAAAMPSPGHGDRLDRRGRRAVERPVLPGPARATAAARPPRRMVLGIPDRGGPARVRCGGPPRRVTRPGCGPPSPGGPPSHREASEARCRRWPDIGGRRRRHRYRLYPGVRRNCAGIWRRAARRTLGNRRRERKNGSIVTVSLRPSAVGDYAGNYRSVRRGRTFRTVFLVQVVPRRVVVRAPCRTADRGARTAAHSARRPLAPYCRRPTDRLPSAGAGCPPGTVAAPVRARDHAAAGGRAGPVARR